MCTYLVPGTLSSQQVGLPEESIEHLNQSWEGAWRAECDILAPCEPVNILGSRAISMTDGVLYEGYGLHKMHAL